jgi:hypothetical protein
MSNVVNFKEFKNQAKAETFKRKVKSKVTALGKWYWDNKEYTIPATVAIAGFATKGLGKIGKELAAQREMNHRDLKSWDPRLGEWLDLKRKLTNSEKVMLDNRMAKGERKIDVLADLGVLK